MADKITPETLAELRRLHAAYLAARKAVIDSRAPGATSTGLEQKLAFAAKMELHEATLYSLIPILDALAAAEAERDRLREQVEAMEPEWDGLRTDKALLRLALRRLEAANEAACAARPQAAYDAMIATAGGADALLELDAARSAARAALGAGVATASIAAEGAMTDPRVEAVKALLKTTKRFTELAVLCGYPEEQEYALSGFAAELVAAMDAVPPAPTHRHRKGGLYRLIGYGNHTETGELFAVYWDADGKLWPRPAAMFDDGRFTPLALAATTTPQEK